MILLRIITFFIPVAAAATAGAFGHNAELRKLVKRTYRQSDAPTVYFIGIGEKFLTEFMKTNIDIPVVVFTSSADDGFWKKSNSSSSALLVVETTNLNLQHKPAMLQRIIESLRVRRFIIVSAESLQNLQQFFSFFLTSKFTRIFGIVGNTSYAYLNYASNPIQELSPSGPLPHALKDLNGYVLRTTIQKDIPRVFWYPDKNGKNTIGGCFGRLMVNFLSNHNATFQETFTGNSTSLFFMPSVINATKNDQIDISLNVWGPTVGLDSSYPVRYQSYTIMVPLNGNLDPNQYFVRPFSPAVWILIGLTLVYIVLMDVAKDIICCRATVDVWKSFSRTLLAILNSPNSVLITDYRFHAQVLLLSFVLYNVYVIHFTSFLTVYIKIKQYDTKVDLVENNVPMMIPTFEWRVVEGPGLTAIGFDKIVYTVDYPDYIGNTTSMQNTKFAYAIGLDRAKFLIGLQTFFAKPLFHTTKDELFTSQLGYLMVYHSPFKEILDTFIHRVSELGLMAKWEWDAVSQSLRAGFKIDVNREAGHQKVLRPLTLNHLQFAWNCLMTGLAVSFIVFAWEKVGKCLIKYLKDIYK